MRNEQFMLRGFVGKEDNSSLIKAEHHTRILVLERHTDFSYTLTSYLTVFGYQASRSENFDHALIELATSQYDFVLLSDEFADIHPVEALRRIKNMCPQLQVIIVAARGDDQLAIALFKAGADDYISRKVKDKHVLVALPEIIDKLQHKNILLSSRRNNQATDSEFRHLSQSEQLFEEIGSGRTNPESNVVKEPKPVNQDPQLNPTRASRNHYKIVSRRLKYLLELSPHPCALVTTELELLKVNNKLANIMEASSKQLENRNVDSFVSRSEYARLKKLTQVKSAALGPNPLELALRKPNGNILAARCNFRVVSNSPQKIFLVEVEDMEATLKIRAEEVAQQLWQELIHTYSEKFINLPVRHFDTEICELLAQAASWLNYFRASVYWLDESSNRAYCRLLWSKQNRYTATKLSKSLAIHASAPELALLNDKKVMFTRDIGEQSRLRVDGSYFPIKRLYSASDSQNVLLTRLHSGAKLQGWIGFELNPEEPGRTGNPRQFAELSKLVVSALVRKKYEDVRRLTHLRLIETHGKLSEEACLDGLTRLANRRYFDRILEAEVRRAGRDKACVSLVFLDVDFFKEYNDSNGHIAGDHCLQKIANTLAQHFQRAGDFVARYGGEEFAVILPGQDCWQAVETTEVLRQKIESLAISHNATAAGKVTLSAGVACCFAPVLSDIEPLMKKTDKALYKAKNSGRNRVVVDD